jgi:hypothetical protein
MRGTFTRTCLVVLFGLAALPVAAWQQAAQSTGTREAQEARIEELWVEPGANRNLLHGVGGPDLAPDPNERYKVREIKLRGFSEGYTVTDSKGREWSTKSPPEAFSEIATSRILWAVGFHQPPVYVLRDWKADGARAPNPQVPARFREKAPKFNGLAAGGTWSFKDNPFVGTRPLGGLLVLQAIIANPDIKPSNNTIYTLTSPAEGASRWYVVRDLGYSLGSSGFNSPRADIESFERAPFIRSVVNGKVQFYFGGQNKKLLNDITVADVQWICQRLAKLTDEQWRDAFRAAAYEPSVAERYIVKLKAKIQEGLAVR